MYGIRTHSTVVLLTVLLLSATFCPAQDKPYLEPNGAIHPTNPDTPVDPAATTAGTHGQNVPNTPQSPLTSPPAVIDRPTSKASPLSAIHPSAVIQEPPQGRPIFITPGDTFYFVMRLPSNIRGHVNFTLRHTREPGIEVNLKPTTPPSYHNEYCSLILQVPERTAPGLYDVEVKADGASYTSHHSVNIIETFKDKFRFVHLSNMNIGDPTAPEFDDMLPKEINILAPEFIIATGDYTEWARARDDASSWERVLQFFEKFDAPVFMLCGLHDHEDSFTQFVASKPIGTIDYGNYHGLLLLDHPGNPIAQDYSQLRWLEKDLQHNRNKTFNFVVTNSDELALLDIWRENGDINAFVKEHKIKMFIVGGSTDWDYREFAQKLDGLDDIHFIRTHQASTSLRDRATGFSHYRVIEVNGDQIAYKYPNDAAAEDLLHSIPTGRLRAFFDQPNDGSSDTVKVTLQNALNQGFADAHVWLRVAKGNQGQIPTVTAGRIERILDAGSHWACDVAVDLPDKGGATVVASTSPAAMPPALPITVELDGDTHWAFKPGQTDFGMSFFTSDASPTIKLTNNADRALTCWPVIRINGTQIHPDRSACPRLPLELKPGETITMPLVLTLRRVSPGPHKLQVHFLEDPLCRMDTFDVTLDNLKIAATEEVPD